VRAPLAQTKTDEHFGFYPRHNIQY